MKDPRDESYVTDFSDYFPVTDIFATLKLNELLCGSGVPDYKLKQIFQHHPDFKSSPVRCKIFKSIKEYDPYTALLFQFNEKHIVIFIPWDWNTDQLIMRSNQVLDEPELGTFIGKTFRYLKAFPLPSAPQPNPLIRLMKRKLKPFIKLWSTIRL